MPVESLWLETVDGNAGGVLLEVFLFIYSFCALAVVCDSHLVLSLETFCVRWGIREDVAGATVMALGSAAPELIISSLNTLQGESDLGVGAILGSGMLAFSVIPGLCALVAGRDLLLKRRPLARDALTYLLALVLLSVFFSDGFIVLWESVALLGLYALYVLMVVLSPSVRGRWLAKERRQAYESSVKSALADGVDREQLEAMRLQYEQDAAHKSFVEKAKEEAEKEREREREQQAMQLSRVTPTQPQRSKRPLSSSLSAPAGLSDRLLQADDIHLSMTVTDGSKEADDAEAQSPAISLTSEDMEEPSLYSVEHDDPLALPASTLYSRAWRWFTLPLQLLFRYSCVDCQHDGPRARLYPLTFLVSFLWVSLFSFVISAVAGRWNSTSGLPLSLFGIVLVAVGAEIPDGVQSLSVARRGYGAMALSNSCGAQITNVLCCLGLPWTIANVAGYSRGDRDGFQCDRDEQGQVTRDGCIDAPGLSSSGMVPWRGVQVREHDDALIAACFQFLILSTFIAALLLTALLQRKGKAVLTRRKGLLLLALYPVAVGLFCLCSQLVIRPTADAQYYAPLEDD